MKVQEVEEMLRRFYEGETTEKQEQRLKEYFKKEVVPEHLVLDKKLFLALYEEDNSSVPAGLNEKLIRMIDEKSAEEAKHLSTGTSRKYLRWVGGIAAGVGLLLSLGYGLDRFKAENNRPQDTFTDPQEAFHVMNAVLIEVSTNLNSGLNQLAEVRQEVKQINSEIQEEIQ